MLILKLIESTGTIETDASTNMLDLVTRAKTFVMRADNRQACVKTVHHVLIGFKSQNGKVYRTK